MSAFDLGRAVEQDGLTALLPFLRQVAFEGRFVITDKGSLAPMLQAWAGDLLMNVGDGRTVVGVEVKTETHDKTGNLFLETWSNRAFGWQNPGWMVTLRTDLLWYYFQDSDRLIVINFKRLWEWAFVAGRLWAYPERVQRKHDQPNVTAGRCVPIAVLGREVGCDVFMPNLGGLASRERLRPAP